MGGVVRRGVRAATGKTPVTALFGGIAAVAGSFAAAGFTGEFAFTPVSEFVVHYTPGWIINTTLEVFGDLGQYINMAFTLFLTVALFTAVIAVAVAVGRRWLSGPALTAGLVWLLAVALTGASLVSLGAAVPAAVVVAMTYRPWGQQETADRTSRWPDEDRRLVRSAVSCCPHGR